MIKLDENQAYTIGIAVLILVLVGMVELLTPEPEQTEPERQEPDERLLAAQWQVVLEADRITREAVSEDAPGE